MGPEDSLKYLGTPFGQTSTHSIIISTIHKRIDDGLVSG